MEIIAHIETDFGSKFGIPRQSGLIEELEGTIVFEPKFRNVDALRGLEDFSHIWIIWNFSEAEREKWSPTVRPPRLGGNTRMGVFATRSPFRPNPIGLSCVKIKKIDFKSSRGSLIHVTGVDMMNHTPIYDIKPYLPITDCHPEALSGFSTKVEHCKLEVVVPEWIEKELGVEKLTALIQVLEGDPRPSYQEDADRVYGMNFAGYNIRFCVDGNQLLVKEMRGV